MPKISQDDWEAHNRYLADYPVERDLEKENEMLRAALTQYREDFNHLLSMAMMAMESRVGEI